MESRDPDDEREPAAPGALVQDGGEQQEEGEAATPFSDELGNARRPQAASSVIRRRRKRAVATKRATIEPPRG